MLVTSINTDTYKQTILVSKSNKIQYGEINTPFWLINKMLDCLIAQEDECVGTLQHSKAEYMQCYIFPFLLLSEFKSSLACSQPNRVKLKRCLTIHSRKSIIESKLVVKRI